MWANELSYRQMAKAFNIRNAGCIGQWERCYHSGETRTREQLLAEVNHLRMEYAYLKKLRGRFGAEVNHVT